MLIYSEKGIKIMKDKYSFFTTNEIKPCGWVRRQLEIEAEGLAGNLDKIWSDIRDSAWIGGNREGWERVPYWLDGFIPLAYLLENEDMIERAKKYVNCIIERQEDDGWICPNGNVPREHYDTWAISLITKTLTVYYECSRDERVPAVILRVLKNYYELLSSGRIKLFAWGHARWFECFVALRMIKKMYPEETWVSELARILKDQGMDYEQNMPLWLSPKNRWDFRTHIVNIAMMFKYEAISADLLGDEYKKLADKLYDFLYRNHGTVTGFLTGDECLSGRDAIQGTELCAVVEFMYSCQWLYAVTGDRKWAELLEMQAFNALPATFTDDMWAHQYVQMTNQIDCSPMGGHPPFGNNCQEAHIFGLEPNFGCCTANMAQGWPKLALSSFMRADDGVICAVALPCSVDLEYKKAYVNISLETQYPFKNSFVYRVVSDRKTAMRLRVRIPSFAKNLRVNGESVVKRDMLVFGGFEKGETVITLSFDACTVKMERPHNLYALRRGSLIFALPIKSSQRKVEYTKAGVERKFPYCDYHIKPESDWNYGFAEMDAEVNEKDISPIPFSSSEPPITLSVPLSHIDWGYEPRYDCVCAANPKGRKALDAPEKHELYPYGCTILRMTEMPKIK